MFLGYNTNGLAHHDLFDAVEMLAEMGYGGVAITIDHNALPPHGGHAPQKLARLGKLLTGQGMRSTIETGARFLLDFRRKHEPTLVSADPAGRQRRIDFYRHAIHTAAELHSDCVSLWSGVLAEGLDRELAWSWLSDGLKTVLDYAADVGVTVAFEPEPGMFIDSLKGYEEVLTRLGDARLRLTLDVGHVHCQGEMPIPAAIRRHAAQLVNVHCEDMRRGVHEHLMFGDGQIDFPPIFAALREVGYAQGVYVELSRHSHIGPTVARQAFDFLRPMVGGVRS